MMPEEQHKVRRLYSRIQEDTFMFDIFWSDNNSMDTTDRPRGREGGK